MKTAPKQDLNERVEQHRQPKTLVDPDDILTSTETQLLKRAEREMKQGKYVTLAQLHHELDRKSSRGRRKTA
jgi:hypothetical protein